MPEGRDHGQAGSERAYVGLVGMRTRDPREIRRRVLQGLSYRAFERFRTQVGLSVSELAKLVSVNERTLSRRKLEGRLQPDESDRLMRAARVFNQAIELFEGDEIGAREWLASTQPAFGGETALDLMRTDSGAREVEQLIGRLEHGVFG
jgi:putative toxin-antitoxin system antitoxin component (TIGR02293 family)